MNILIVDDTPDLREVYILHLTKSLGQKYCFFTAKDGEEGVKKALEIETQHGGLGLVISDYDMPKLNGIQMKANIDCELKRSIPGILVTSYEEELMTHKSLFHAYIQKPIIDYEEMAKIIKKLEAK